MKLKRLLATSLFLMVLLPAWPGAAWAVTVSARDVKKVAGEFACNCGCGKNLAVCDDKGCGPTKREFIREQLEAGKTKEQVIEIMKAQYGSEIMAAPEKEGFHLIAWITPFAVVFFGIVAVVKVMTGWIARRREQEADGDGPGDAPTNHTYDDRIDKELKDFGW